PAIAGCETKPNRVRSANGNPVRIRGRRAAVTANRPRQISHCASGKASGRSKPEDPPSGKHRPHDPGSDVTRGAGIIQLPVVAFRGGHDREPVALTGRPGVRRMGADESRRTAVVMSWSGGKDCALALHELRADPRYEVMGLMTSVSEEFRRVSHHGVREEL